MSFKLMPLFVTAGLYFGLVSASPALAEVNTIRVELPVDGHELLKTSKGKKVSIQGRAVIEVDGAVKQTLPVELRTRGQSCLSAERRCLELEFQEKVELPGVTGVTAKTFNLVSMWQDSGYISTRLGFEIFRSLEFFDLRTEYARLFINGEPQGLYLATEKPKRAIRRLVGDDSWVGRRSYGASVETVDSAESLKDSAAQAHFKAIYSDVRNLSGDALLQSLREKMELGSYMDWILVNSLLMNGDFADEVYVYIDAKRKPYKLGIFPWDFDDLFKAPHAGEVHKTRAEQFKTSLLYGFENPLDAKIADDQVLYSELSREARELFHRRIDENMIRGVFARVRAALAPYVAYDDVRALGAKDSRHRAYQTEDFDKILKSRESTTIERLRELRRRLGR
ncbi:MAG: CotH kinase family protein [Bdellovibrionales bacterium]|nr:CotH kinase family protein [Bdellovibrionales bacterium]